MIWGVLWLCKDFVTCFCEVSLCSCEGKKTIRLNDPTRSLPRPLLPFSALYCHLLPFLSCLLLSFTVFTALHCSLLSFTALDCPLLPSAALYCPSLCSCPLLHIYIYVCIYIYIMYMYICIYVYMYIFYQMGQWLIKRSGRYGLGYRSCID